MWTLENYSSCIDMLQAAYNILNENGKILVATLFHLKNHFFLFGQISSIRYYCFRFSFNFLNAALAKSKFQLINSNRYIDNDILCLIAEKNILDNIPFEKDKNQATLYFFKRWHKETVYYSKFRGKQ